MTEEDPKASLVEVICEVQRANNNLLHSNGLGILPEIIELANDAIDYVPLIEKAKAGQSAMTFFLSHVLMPQSNGLYVTVLSGNLPMSFATLRLLVETLAKCYYADAFYPETFFPVKLELIVVEARMSTTALITRVDEMAGTGDQLRNLWRDLSNAWIHTQGLASGLVDHIGEKGFPNWGIILPSEYSEADFNAINELTEKIAAFRGGMKHVIENWRQRP